MRSSSATDRLIAGFNGWLGSRAGLIQSVIVTVGWVPFVLLHVDAHGFIYLYVATALSLITNFSLAIYARHLQGEQEKFEAWLEQMMRNQSDSIRVQLELAKHQGVQLEEIKEELDFLADD